MCVRYRLWGIVSFQIFLAVEAVPLVSFPPWSLPEQESPLLLMGPWCWKPFVLVAVAFHCRGVLLAVLVAVAVVAAVVLFVILCFARARWSMVWFREERSWLLQQEVVFCSTQH